MGERDIDVLVHCEQGERAPVWWAESPDWPGCYSAGDTLAECIEGMQDALRLILEEDGHVSEVRLRQTLVADPSYNEGQPLQFKWVGAQRG